MKFKYCILVGGNSSHIRIAADIVEQSIAADFEPMGGEFDTEILSHTPSLNIDKKLYADAGYAGEVVVGICVFCSTWLGNKLLDELYDKGIKSSFKRFVDAFYSNKRCVKNKIDLFACTHFADIDLTVVIRLTTTESLTLEQRDRLFRHANVIAARFIDENGKLAPVHYYHVQSESINIQPMLRESLEQIQCEKWP
ncbi:hypothetical protein G6329_17335 [Vibrio cholerae]|uniref:hypothetical protein n=1 Tax=Vibrio cholerae TaxID=666 RepID=UPI0028DAB981|nr:hypothetical protein [Vibrio cholerae]EKF9975314.1 hypothetical protein [Vibrio cholerae]ELJ8487496.1 hypothetical protein [Vibrio cholerae]ELK0391735.1 hypothetical protein [Vibrio cholerae]HDL9487841.1 hypothetical protein [Vibrio cholerae]